MGPIVGGSIMPSKSKAKTKKRTGTVGAYLLQQMGPNNDWMTLVHKRSNQVEWSKNALATPGGSVNREDLNHCKFS